MLFNIFVEMIHFFQDFFDAWIHKTTVTFDQFNTSFMQSINTNK